jgi:hypothetical protein
LGSVANSAFDCMDDVLPPNFGYFFAANRFNSTEAVVAVRSMQTAFWYVCRSPRAMSQGKQHPQQLTALNHSVGGGLARHGIDDYDLPFLTVTNNKPIAFIGNPVLHCLVAVSRPSGMVLLYISGGSAPSVPVRTWVWWLSCCAKKFFGNQPSGSKLICVYKEGKGTNQCDSGKLTLLGSRRLVDKMRVASLSGSHYCNDSYLFPTSPIPRGQGSPSLCNSKYVDPWISHYTCWFLHMDCHAASWKSYGDYYDVLILGTEY